MATIAMPEYRNISAIWLISRLLDILQLRLLTLPIQPAPALPYILNRFIKLVRKPKVAKIDPTIIILMPVFFGK